MNRVWAWLDNPIFVKHLRSRLRSQSLSVALVIVLVLCACIIWGGIALNGFTPGYAFGAVMGLQSMILVIMGASQVGGSVGGARASGILDFHRVSPVSPTALTLGFFFGAPVREYLLFACTLPFALFCVVMGAPTVFNLVQLTIALLLTAWILHAIALLSVLVAKKPRGATNSGTIAVGVLFLISMSGGIVYGFARVANAVDAYPTLNFFGVSLPWLAFMLLYEVPALFFLFLASNRKMVSDRAHPYTKPEAVACMATFTVLLLGGVWDVKDYDYLVLIVLYALVVGAIVLISTVTPSLGEYVKGVRRAKQLGRTRLGPWDSLSPNRLVLVVLCTIVLIGATTAWNLIESPHYAAMTARQGTIGYSLAIAIGVLVVAYYGLAYQFVQLAFPRRAGALLGLFLFLVWLVPLLLGAIASAANLGHEQKVPQVLFGLSPLAGIGLATGVGTDPGNMAVQAAALCPALVFAFLFNNLVTLVRRRADMALLMAAMKAAAAEKGEPVRA